MRSSHILGVLAFALVACFGAGLYAGEPSRQDLAEKGAIVCSSRDNNFSVGTVDRIEEMSRVRVGADSHTVIQYVVHCKICPASGACLNPNFWGPRLGTWNTATDDWDN